MVDTRCLSTLLLLGALGWNNLFEAGRVSDTGMGHLLNFLQIGSRGLKSGPIRRFLSMNFSWELSIRDNIGWKLGSVHWSVIQFNSWIIIISDLWGTKLDVIHRQFKTIKCVDWRLFQLRNWVAAHDFLSAKESWLLIRVVITHWWFGVCCWLQHSPLPVICQECRHDRASLRHRDLIIIALWYINTGIVCVVHWVNSALGAGSRWRCLLGWDMFNLLTFEVCASAPWNDCRTWPLSFSSWWHVKSSRTQGLFSTIVHVF